MTKQPIIVTNPITHPPVFLTSGSDLSVWDLSIWKPCTKEEYLEMFGEVFLTLDEPETTITWGERLPDNRMRIVTFASIKRFTETDGPEGGNEPFLMILANSETGKQFYFVRSDVELAMD